MKPIIYSIHELFRKTYNSIIHFIGAGSYNEYTEIPLIWAFFFYVPTTECAYCSMDKRFRSNKDWFHGIDCPNRDFIKDLFRFYIGMRVVQVSRVSNMNNILTQYKLTEPYLWEGLKSGEIKPLPFDSTDIIFKILRWRYGRFCNRLFGVYEKSEDWDFIKWDL